MSVDVKQYPKGAKVPLSANFTTADFDCHCRRPGCSVTLVSGLLVECLEQLRLLIGDFQIDSGFRCHAHNAEVGGAANSQHCQGHAADCKSKRGLTGAQVAAQAEKIIPFHDGGIGTYPTFAHCDVRGTRARWKGASLQAAPC